MRMGNHTLSRPSVNCHTVLSCPACADPPEALIGLTAVRHGATVVTANHTDFELLTREIPLSLFPV